MHSIIRKNLSVSLFFSYKLTALVTLLVSLVNILFWLNHDFKNIFSGYTINPNATMKVITSISFLILGTIYFIKKRHLIKILIFSGLFIQLIQLSLIYFDFVDPIDWKLSSTITVIMFVLAFLALYFIKVRRFKVVFLMVNGLLYILSSFAVFYYLLDMQELNAISGFETLSWNTAMIFFMNSISLFELKLIKRISPIKLDQITSKNTHPYNYFPYFFLIPILFIVITSALAYHNIITVIQAAFFIILFLNTSSFINMFFYSYNFIIFYIEITKKSSKLRNNNRKLNAMNAELLELNQKLKKKNSYLEDFATITSHNLREPIIALEELQKVSEQITSDESFTNEEVQTMFNTSIQRLNQGINSLVQYHNFIKNEDLIDDQKISLKAGIEYIYSNLEKSIPKNTSLTISIKDDLILSKNCIDTVFRNLLSNSFKYKRENVDLKITISAYKVNNTYNILYKDNGSGINLIFFKKHLFRKRKRFHKRSHNSNGYGLYFTELCIKKLNGKMDIFSTPGKGTAFRIKIKLPHSYE